MTSYVFTHATVLDGTEGMEPVLHAVVSRAGASSKVRFGVPWGRSALARSTLPERIWLPAW